MAANLVLRFAATADARIHFLAPTMVGERLTATARTSFQDRRRAVIYSGITPEGRIVALFRGTARTVRRA